MGTFGQGSQAQREPALALAPEHRLEHRVAPAQVLLAELLSLPNAELEHRIAVELGANPALELPVPASCPGCGSALWGLTLGGSALGGSALGRGGCVRCSAGGAGTTPFNQQRLDYAAFAVQARLSMTGLVTMQVRDLQRQLTASTDILIDLASHLQLPCRPGITVGDTVDDPWGSLEVLVGDQLRADGVDLF